jgi:hypothetical protein
VQASAGSAAGDPMTNRGVVMGRKPKLTHHQRLEAIARREAGEALVDIGRSYNVNHSTISRL